MIDTELEKVAIVCKRGNTLSRAEIHTALRKAARRAQKEGESVQSAFTRIISTDEDARTLFKRYQKLGSHGPAYTPDEPEPGKPAPGNSFTRPLPQTFPANAALRAAILEHAAAHPEMSIPQATASLLETPEGAKLNRAATQERLYGERVLASAG